MISRRGIITGLCGLIAAPAIVRAANISIMRGAPLAANDLLNSISIPGGAWRLINPGTPRRMIDGGELSLVPANWRECARIAEIDTINADPSGVGTDIFAYLRGRTCLNSLSSPPSSITAG